MDNINNFMRGNPRYKSLSKPLTAAKVCDAARSLTHYHLNAISFKEGLLTLGTTSSAEANNLQMQSTQIIKEVNEKIGETIVLRLRFKITDQR